MEIKLHDIFVSVQGEGMNVGKPAIFIRLFGCSKECDFCDTPQDSIKDLKISTVEDIVAEVYDLRENTGHETVIITGGEPTEQRESLNALIKELKSRNFTLFLETNGSGRGVMYSLFDHVCVCPKDLDVRFEDLFKSNSVEIKFLLGVDEMGVDSGDISAAKGHLTKLLQLDCKPAAVVFQLKCPSEDIGLDKYLDDTNEIVLHIDDICEHIVPERFMDVVRVGVQLHKLLGCV